MKIDTHSRNVRQMCPFLLRLVEVDAIDWNLYDFKRWMQTNVDWPTPRPIKLYRAQWKFHEEALEQWRVFRNGNR